MSEFNKKDNKLKNNKKAWNVGSLFWGLLFVLIGGLVLAENLGWISVHWGSMLSLWPILIIVTGLSILAVRGFIWRAVVLTLILMSLLLVGSVAGGYVDFSSQTRNTSVIAGFDGKEVKSASLHIKAGAGEISVNSNDQDSIVKSRLDSNIAELVQDVSHDGSDEKINLTMSTLRQGWIGGVHNNLDVMIGRKIPISFSMDFGAAKANIDLAEVRVTNVNLKSGASSTILTVGKKAKTVDISIESGASSTVVRIPLNSGVKLNMDSGLISKELADLIETSSGVYQSSNYSDSKNIVNITAKLGVASFKIERY